MTAGRHIPEATVARLPVYLRSLVELAELKIVTISSERLADLAGVNAAKLRKDLSYLGSYGTRGVGYDVEFLLYQISRQLGLTQDWPIVIVGIGNLGRALANYRGFPARGFRIVALFDADASKVGERLGEQHIRDMAELDEVVRAQKVAIGVIATPAIVAQEVADRLVDAGVASILNFAPVVISVPEHIALRKVDLSIELQILSFYHQRSVSSAGLMPPISDGPGVSAPVIAGSVVPGTAVTGSAVTGSAVTGSTVTGSAVTGSAVTGSAVTATPSSVLSPSVVAARTV